MKQLFDALEISEEAIKALNANPDDLIRRGDAINAIRKACIMEHIPFSSRSPEGKRTLEAIQAVSLTPAAKPHQIDSNKTEIKQKTEREGEIMPEYIDSLEKEIADREECSIQQHSDLHYWSNRAKKAEKERDLAIAELKQAADDTGGCFGCKWLDKETDECTNSEGRLMCDRKTNNMWEWKGFEG